MLYVGIDAGGSKTKLLARASGHEDLTLVGPAANLQAVGVEGVARIFSSLMRQALEARPGTRIRAACAGVAGAGRATDRDALIVEWRRQLDRHAPPHLVVHHDGVIAVEAAFEGGSGIILITGTGSVGLAKADDGSLHRVGGWGYLLGDEGSGMILGLEGLKAVAAAMDGGPPTRLVHLLADRLGIRSPDALIHHVYQERGQAPLFAPVVLEAAQDGDDVARQIVQEQLARLALQVRWLANRCGPIEERVALVGGLSGNAYFSATLELKLREVLPGWSVDVPSREPVLGALRLATAADGQIAQAAAPHSLGR